VTQAAIVACPQSRSQDAPASEAQAPTVVLHPHQIVAVLDAGKSIEHRQRGLD
jgi:hypothetical protein